MNTFWLCLKACVASLKKHNTNKLNKLVLSYYPTNTLIFLSSLWVLDTKGLHKHWLAMEVSMYTYIMFRLVELSDTLSNFGLCLNPKTHYG